MKNKVNEILKGLPLKKRIKFVFRFWALYMCFGFLALAIGHVTFFLFSKLFVLIGPTDPDAVMLLTIFMLTLSSLIIPLILYNLFIRNLPTKKLIERLNQQVKNTAK